MARFDVHSHLLPAVDDGCANLAESVECARMLVDAGFSHSFCTPHAWPSHKHLTRVSVPQLVADLQSALDDAAIPLTLVPGSELNLHPGVTSTPEEMLIPLDGPRGRYILVDMWAEALPEWFAPAVRWLQSRNLTVVLGHPERMRAVQDDPGLVDVFLELGVLLQGNLQCFADRPSSDTRRTAERFLLDNRYFVLGSDCHNITGLRTRLQGLQNAIELAGPELIDRLTVSNPRLLLSGR